MGMTHKLYLTGVYEGFFLDLEELEPGVFKIGGTTNMVGIGIVLGFSRWDAEVENLAYGVEEGYLSDHLKWKDVDLNVNVHDDSGYKFRAPSIERIKEALTHVEICMQYFEWPFGQVFPE